MEKRWGRVNLTRLRARARIGASAVSDIKEKRRSVGVDVVEKIAGALGSDVHPWQLLHPQGVQADSSGLSSEALRIARQLDDLANDPVRRAWAMKICELAAFARPPKTPEETFGWVAGLAQQLQASAEHPADE